MHRTSPHSPLAGSDNAFVKRLRSLADAKGRKRERSFLIEGVKMVEEALRDNAGVRLVTATPALLQHHAKGLLKLADSRGVEVVWISDRLMDKLSDSKSPQPVMAEVTMPQTDEAALFKNPAGLIVVAARLQDPGNLGTIIRTAEAVTASGVAITAGTVDPYNAKAVRASMGSIFRVPVVESADLKTLIRTAKEHKFQTVAAVAAGGSEYFDADLRQATMLILGQESAGLAPEDLSGVDLRLGIPMAPTIDSLNVAVAGAVVLYEVMRQRARGNSGERRG